MEKQPTGNPNDQTIFISSTKQIVKSIQNICLVIVIFLSQLCR